MEEHSMKAIANRRYGSADGLELVEVERPEVAPDGVLVRVCAAAVNPYDVHAMRGRPYVARLVFGLRRPKQPLVGLDFAGVVEAVGPEADGFSVGDEVVGARPGALAEYVSATKA